MKTEVLRMSTSTTFVLTACAREACRCDCCTARELFVAKRLHVGRVARAEYL